MDDFGSLANCQNLCPKSNGNDGIFYDHVVFAQICKIQSIFCGAGYTQIHLVLLLYSSDNSSSYRIFCDFTYEKDRQR